MKENFINIFDRYASQINNLCYPGAPLSKIAIFTPEGMKNRTVFTESGPMDIEKYVNEDVLPFAFMNGIMLVGMTHGNFYNSRSYLKPEEVVLKKWDDYDGNPDVLNFAFACMSAAAAYEKGTEQNIMVVSYWGEPDFSAVAKFKDEKEFRSAIEEELSELEEGDEEDE